ncbi:glutamine synthetase/guanido kinase [Stipitochalara longipes BDJ]|nr:glutamine synthetase/guanido kinase [Stipitochalara longipes BDJ]
MGEISEPNMSALSLRDGAANSTALETFLAINPSIEFIRFQWLDYSNVLTVRVTTKKFAQSLAAKHEPITTPCPILTALLVTTEFLLEDFDIGEDEVWPDWSSLKVCHYHPGHAQVMCFIYEGGEKNGKGFRRCPRSRLQEITHTAKKEHDIDLLVGVEIEFCIYDASKGTPEQLPVAPHVWSAASLNNKYTLIIEEIVHSITKAGIDIRQWHTEGGPGIWEISLEPLAPLQAEDSLIYCEEAIKNIARQHGLGATLYPKPFEKLSGIGLHHHLSISQKHKEDAFLASLLEHWKSLAAFFMPNYDSNIRNYPGEWISWSEHNKSATIRKVRPGHWELRGIDGTANPYLTMTAILTVGLLGISKGKKLTMKDHKKIAMMGFEEKEAEEFGIKDKMPTSLKEALANLKSNEELNEALGQEILDRYLKVKGKEEEAFGKMILSERRAMSMVVF